MKRNLIKTISMATLAVTILSVNPLGANAAWKQDSTGWWYTEGNSWATGWRHINGAWYYFDANGYMKTGWVKDGGSWYYMNESGAMQTGWLDLAGTPDQRYYLNSNGAMQIGWANIDGKTYHFSNSGNMDKMTVVDNYYIDPNGVRGVKVNISNADEAQGIAILEDEGFLEHYKGKYEKVKAVNCLAVVTLKGNYLGDNNFGLPDEPYYSFTVLGGNKNASDDELTVCSNYFVGAVSKRVFAMGPNLNCKVYEIKDGKIVNTFAPANLELDDWR